MPKVNAFLLAERVLRDADTGRYTVVGIFDTINLDNNVQPSIPWCVFVSIFDLPVGHIKLELRISRSDDGTTKFIGHGNINVPNQLNPPVRIESGLHVGVIEIEQGEYDVSLSLDNTLAAKRKLFVKNKEEPTDGNATVQD